MKIERSITEMMEGLIQVTINRNVKSINISAYDHYTQDEYYPGESYQNPVIFNILYSVINATSATQKTVLNYAR